MCVVFLFLLFCVVVASDVLDVWVSGFGLQVRFKVLAAAIEAEAFRLRCATTANHRARSGFRTK